MLLWFGKLIEKKTVSGNYLNKTAGCAKLSLKFDISIEKLNQGKKYKYSIWLL